MLDILLLEMDFALSSPEKWKIILEVRENGEGAEEMTGEGAEDKDEKEERLERMMGGMLKDYEYLKKMKKMDMEIQEQARAEEEERRMRVEMSDVVPVAGLVMARFHMYENELLTAVDMWGTPTETTGFFFCGVFTISSQLTVPTI